MMCDNGEEVKQQTKLKLKKEKREQEIEKQWIDLEHQQMQDFDKKTVQKLEKDYKNKIANVKLVDKQIKEFRTPNSHKSNNRTLNINGLEIDNYQQMSNES